jgi:hypothetical protein
MQRETPSGGGQALSGKENAMAKDAAGGAQEKPVEEQAQEQRGQRQVRIGIDEHDMTSVYANAFRTNGTAEEVMLDFGLNLVNPAQGQENRPDLVFQVSQRMILNYYTAKRLAITLGQLIRRHEEQFGELELDMGKRQKSSP